MMTWEHFSKKSACALVIMTLWSFADAGAAEKVRISVTNYNMSYLAAGVAAKKGFFREEGLEAEIIRMNANVAMSALIAGEVDYTMIFGSVVRAAMRGAPVRVVAVLIESPPYALIAKPGVTSIKALKGKTIGIGVYGSTNDVVARMILEQSGIDPNKEVKVVAFGSDSARFGALKADLVDAAIIAPPADAQARKAGFNILARANDFLKFPHIGLGTSNRVIAERPQELKKVIKGFLKANRFIRDNRDESIRILAEWGRTEKQDAADAYDSTRQVFSPDGSLVEEGMRLVIDDAKKALKVTRPVALTEVSDTGALREAQRELGLKSR
ncbi:MAG: ABC transporter substrate-binding protein [Deltaproteobacteria bacterium]|nr:ABC transporter substrate-binding protein [Deltaproteobacteria bacterium]